LNSALLDTSFLISFSDPTRPHHLAADQYYQECRRRQVLMFISTIAISEFEIRQPITDLPMRSFIVLPFNVDHARRCAALSQRIIRDAGDSRVTVKDDLKLIAQCACEGITHLLTEDAKTLAKYLLRLNPEFSQPVRPVLLRDGFDPSHFENGQHRLLP
jgi:predicted nucleic acid-binding protein